MVVLAVDAGGSCSRAVLLERDGRVLGIARGGAAHAALPPTTLQAALAALVDGLPPTGSPLAVIAGFAGAGRSEGACRAEDALRKALAAAHFRVGALELTTDGDIALRSVDPGSRSAAAVLIAGTGSIGLAGVPGGPLARAGGWGRYLGDEGGGFWLGRHALEAVGRWVDGRSPDALALARATLDLLGLPDADALTLVAADLWADATRVAALAPLVLDLAQDGDPAAAALVRTAGQALADILLAARRAAGLMPAAPTGLAGGLWRGEALGRALLAALPPDTAATCRPLPLPPVLGAACSTLSAEARVRLATAWAAHPPWAELLR